MTDERFSQLVSEAIELIPAHHLKKLSNVAIVIADNPSVEELREGRVEGDSTLLGLYQGIPLTQRGDFYGAGEILPDKITIFKMPIVHMAGGDESKLKEIVRDTVWHEIAHYFGYDDEEIAVREQDGKNFSV